MTHPESWFAADYADARTKFLGSATAADATVTSYRHPHAQQPNGDDLFVDVARLGPLPREADLVVLASSGTHGVEGFCGSGCQVGMLETDVAARLPAGCALVLVHAINPYGFAWLRRVNEDNIDLNRNNIDHELGHPANPQYDEVHSWLAIAQWEGLEKQKADNAITSFIAGRGLFAFQTAVTGGQYDHPDGLFYGGRALSWSAQTWRAIINEHCRGAKKVAYLDFHTGLGDHGACEIISIEGINRGSDDRARRWYGNDVKSPERNESLSAMVTGSMENGFRDIAANTEVTAVALEYGTKPVLDVLDALRADNWLHLHGDIDSDLGKAIKKQIRDAFYGDTPEWKQMIWDTADKVLDQAAAGLSV